MARVLIFCTATFPYGTGETFIEHEIQYLAETFDRIILISNNTHDTITRNVPDTVTCTQVSYELSRIQKCMSFIQLCNPLFYKELRIIRRTYKKSFSKLQILTALQTLHKTKVIGSKISKIISACTHKSDALYAYSYWANDMACTLTKLHTKHAFTRCISRAHRWDVYFEANVAQYLPFRHYILEHSDGIWFISNAGEQYYSQLFPNLRHKMYMSRLGVLSAGVCPSKTDTTIRIISCSNLIPVKQVHKIIEALANIDSLPIEWIHFGDGHLRGDLESLSAKYLTEKTNCSYTFAGQKTNQEVLEFYAKNHVDVFINVSSSEGIPVSIMEAMSFGIPCIGTDVGGVNEIISDSHNGYLLPAQTSVQEIADAITRIATLDSQQKTHMRNNAYATWQTRYNAEKNYRDFAHMLTN